jgi:arylsulfatase A-like enzyme
VVHELPDSPGLLSRRLEQVGYARGYTGKWHLGYGKNAREDPWYRTHSVESAADVVEYPREYNEATGLPTTRGWEGYDYPGHGDGGHHYEAFRRHLAERGLSFDLKKVPGGAEVLGGEETTVDHWLVDQAIELADRFRARGGPFHVNLNFWGPHGPSHVPSRFVDPFRALEIPPWPTFEEASPKKPGIHRAKISGRPWSPGLEGAVRMRAAYMHYTDWEIGRFLDRLSKDGVYDDAWIIFTTDHGDMLGHHGGMHDKGFQMYEDTVSIPLIVKPPKGLRPAAPRLDAFVNTTDLYATILDIAGSPEAEARHGRSVRPLIDGTAADWTDVVVSDFTGLGYMTCSMRMIRWKHWKYVFHCAGQDELYDLAADPSETDNRIDDSGASETLRTMRLRLADELDRLGDRIVGAYRMMRCETQGA